VFSGAQEAQPCFELDEGDRLLLAETMVGLIVAVKLALPVRPSDSSR
jgi:hypothetical protein